METPKAKQIHVLVEVPEGASDAEAKQKAKLTTLAMLLKQCGVVGDLPQKGDFLKLFEWTDGDCGKVMAIKAIDDIVHFTGSRFYVRKEILCVLTNFKNIYQSEFDTGKVVNKQFVLMGSPGTGKSCILALMCFYIAVHHKRPVVWFRQVVGGIYMTTTRLFYEGKYYEWKDQKGEILESLYYAFNSRGVNPTNCWFCLDGMDQAGVYEKKCDLEYFGHKHMQMQESDVDARFFVSGGSLREFLNYDGAKTTVKTALNLIAKPEDAENLLTMYGIGSNKQIDRIRMRGVQDLNNVDHYVDLWKWTSCVMSKLVLHHLTAMMKPNFFEKLMAIAKGMNDDRLEGVAFEGYFHTLVRHRRPICVHYCKYDNVGRRLVANWETIMRQEIGRIDWKELALVECEGGNRTECVAVMESWAANPSKMDYWIPSTSLCETIDAVAK
ncbi:hypothetical protein PC112_g23110 [Phytophthora cactorum]|nr:hypothetical protein PC112_g23110 [Phytophthora cactorum]